MSKRSWLILAVVVVVFAAGIAAGVTVFGNSSSPAAVTLEPATSVGAHPFTGSVAGSPVSISKHALTVTAASRKTLTENPTTHTLVSTGTAPGLYGGSGDTHVCDPRQLVAFLQQNPDKATAWTGVLGIAPSKIAGYVGTLTPVLLTNDTLVTNHGFLNGHATTLQSVLQAGTAVMVDTSGTPRVKCNCGNPLTPPELITTARLRGTGWPGYTPAQVTVVNAGPVIKSFTLVNITTGSTYTQPVGGGTTAPASPANGTAQWVAVEALPKQAADTAIITSTDGHTWKTVGPGPTLTSGLAWGEGKWIAVAEVGGAAGGGLIYESTDLSTWTQVAQVTSTLSGVAYNNGRWEAVGATTDSSGTFSEGAVYTSTDGTSWTPVFSAVGTNALAVAFGNGQWLAAAHELGASSGGSNPGVVTFASANGVQWAKGVRLNSPAVPWLGFGSGKWLLGGGAGATSQQLYESADATTWTPVTPARLGATRPNVAAYGNGTWLAAGQYGSPPAGSNLYPGSAFFSSPDGKTWTRVAQIYPPISALAYGPVQKVGVTTTTAPPTTAPPTTTPQTTVASTAGAPCDQSLIQAAAGQNVSVHSVSCVGPWAAAGAREGQDDVSLLFHWNGSAWEPADKATACNSGELPKVDPFWQIACNSN